ncbi:hypothetical protein [Chromobacterium haemolyticum]|uniref:hypothetical protein n=1 Tax=Chromobacterium haemolyticum TaxID=394935 RepID=UPI001317F59B|nr:hypothetical protein [Chromobacterium haemolyticum]BBH12881.1 hypothetical protein CH06BL_21290 [Chromobacterium haemolyticum]
MISHHTILRDYLEIAKQARAGELLPRFQPEPVSPELRRRRDDSWQRRLERELAGEDPFNSTEAPSE